MKSNRIKFSTLHKIAYLFIVMIIMLASCKKDDNDIQGTAEDVSGFWIISETITGDCHGSVETEQETEIFSIEQTNNNLKITVYPNGDQLNGTINGEKISWSGTLPTSSGNMDITFSGNCSNSGTNASGNASWEWYSNTYNCSGTTVLTGNKVTSENANFEGEWNGSWDSEENSVDGIFSANVTQTGTTLSGTIDVPYLGLTNANLKGLVNGNVVFFGDVDDKIKFVGTLNEDSGEGTYSYMSLNDEGSWQATRGGSAGTKTLTLIESFPIDVVFEGCSDLTFDGTHFWALSSGKIYKLGTEGSIIDTFKTPGNYPRGITYNGTNLLVGDNSWGTNKIYKLETSLKTILELPGSGNITGLSKGKGGFWCADYKTNAPMIYKIDSSGETTHSFSVNGRSINGLCFDGDNLWISYKNFEMFDHNKISKLDTLGNILKTFDPPIDDLGGICFDGKFLWYHAEDIFFKLDTLGNTIKTISSPVSSEGDIAFNGQYLWSVSMEYEEESKVYKIDTLGNEISSFNCPGTNQKGLAFDGTHLRLTDVVTKKLYKLPTDGDYYIPFPTFDIQFLSSGTNFIFTNNTSEEEIVLMNKSGVFESSFNYPNNMTLEGMSAEGENIWLVDNSIFNMNSLIKTDHSGSILETYSAPANTPAADALFVNDENIWCITKDNDEDFYRLSKFELSD